MKDGHLSYYFEFLGIKNEGVKRLLVIVLVLFGLYIYPFLEDDLYFDSVIDYLLFDDFEESLIFYFHFFITSPIIVGVVVKTFMWVKDGFSQK